MGGSTTPVPDEALGLGQLLVQRGIVRPEAVAEALRLQRDRRESGQVPPPRLGELLVELGHLTTDQVIAALSNQDKEILWCPRCSVRVNVRRRPAIASYKCARCEGTLQPPESPALSVRDSSIILVSRDPLPEEVERAADDPSKRFGKYLLLSEIGRGAVGVVWRAWDTYLNQYVALKLIQPPAGATADDEGWRESRVFSLLKEARNAVRLRHPNIVSIHDVGRVGREYYISMEHLQGATLAERVKQSRDLGRISPYHENPRRWLHAMRDLARASHYAHTRPNPVVHCDLKPSNVFIDDSGRAFILDFGLARDLRSLRREAAGTVRGTPCYMAPEQAAGRTDDIDPRTDVYGLGAILYELLTGRPPFDGDLVEVLQKVVSEPPVRPSDAVTAPGATASDTRTRHVANIPPAVEEICLRCLEKDRGNRFADARELADAIDRVLKRTDRTTRKDRSAAAAIKEEEISRALDGSLAFRDLRKTIRRHARRQSYSMILLAAMVALLGVWVGFIGARLSAPQAVPAAIQDAERIADLAEAALPAGDHAARFELLRFCARNGLLDRARRLAAPLAGSSYELEAKRLLIKD